MARDGVPTPVVDANAGAAAPGTTPRPFSDMPGPRGLALLRTLSGLAKRPLETLTALRSSYGDIVALRFPLDRIVLVCDPDGIEHVLVHQHQRYAKATPRWKTMRQVWGEGLLDRGRRRVASPATAHAARLPPAVPARLRPHDGRGGRAGRRRVVDPGEVRRATRRLSRHAAVHAARAAQGDVRRRRRREVRPAHQGRWGHQRVHRPDGPEQPAQPPDSHAPLGLTRLPAVSACDGGHPSGLRRDHRAPREERRAAHGPARSHHGRPSTTSRRRRCLRRRYTPR